jgi:beta-glucosidase
LAATWNPDRTYEEGVAQGREARARGLHRILGPGMDFYRTPLGGRNGEYMTGEDPLLGAVLVPAEINGMQSQEVMSTAKHYACNDQEFNREFQDVEVDERTLREIYLPPFEGAAKLSRSAAFMGAFTIVNGDYACESRFLDHDVLKRDWGFQGFIESDFGAIHDGLKAALAGMDLDQPGGVFAQMTPANLLPAIQSGQLSLDNIDDKVRRILREIVTFGFLDRPQQDTSIPVNDPRSKTTAVDVAREGIVLLKSDSQILPLDKNATRAIAVIGANAQGEPPTVGGSAFVPASSDYTSEIDGIKAKVGVGARVDYIASCVPDPSTAAWQHISGGQVSAGLVAQYFNSLDFSGPSVTRVENELNISAFSATTVPVSDPSNFSAIWTGQVKPTITGDQVFKVFCAGVVRLYVDGQLIIDNFSAPYAPSVPVSGKVHLQTGVAYDVRLEFKTLAFAYVSFGGWSGIQFSWASLQPPPELAGYNAAVLALGTNQQYEAEGRDRASFQLPEFQDELILNACQLNPRTIVVLHGSGSFDVQAWINRVPALVDVWFPGQYGGQALAEVLFGDVNPSGKLPITWEKRLQDNPAYASLPAPDAPNTIDPAHPVFTTITYSEGLFVGYRGYEHNGIQPQYPFGFGLSYTTFAYSDLKIAPLQLNGNNHVNVSFTVTNTGNLAGAEIAELYVGQQNSPIARPIKELKGFQKVFLQPGASQKVTLELAQRSVAYFNTTIHQWDGLPGTYNVLVGASLQDIRLSGQFSVKSEFTFQP